MDDLTIPVKYFIVLVKQLLNDFTVADDFPMLEKIVLLKWFLCFIHTSCTCMFIASF